MRAVLEATNETTQGAPPSAALLRLDPRGRIIAAAAYAITVVSLNQVTLLIAAVILSMTVMIAARLPPLKSLKRMAMMDSFIIIMLLMLPFTVPGTPLFTLWGLPASLEGIEQAVVIALKANAVVLALMGLVGSMEPATLGHALARLRVPENLIHLMLFTIRYIEVIHQESHRLRIAMKMRGFRPRNSLHTYRTYGYLIGMLLVRALERSERILNAMKCRGFIGRLPLLDRLSWGKNDGAFAILWLVMLVLLLCLNHVPGLLPEMLRVSFS